MTNSIMKGKKGLIIGLANERSIAWGIAQSVVNAGGSIALTYMADQYEDKMKPLAQKLQAEFITKLNVLDSASIDETFKTVESKWQKLDFVVHAIAFSDKKELSGRYVDTSVENFLNSMHVSCFSFTEIAKRCLPLMKDGGSLLTISYYGAKKVIPNYNIMGICKAALETSVYYLASDVGKQGIRVNAISAGPIRTLASSAIQDFHGVLNTAKSTAPLGRNVTIEEVGQSAVYLLSDMSSGVTGEVLYVDAGYNVIGMESKSTATQE